MSNIVELLDISVRVGNINSVVNFHILMLHLNLKNTLHKFKNPNSMQLLNSIRKTIQLDALI